MKSEVFSRFQPKTFQYFIHSTPEYIMLPKHPWLKKCIEHLQKLPNIKTTETLEPYLKQVNADALLSIYTADKRHEYVVEIKSNVTFKTIENVIQSINYIKQQVIPDQHPLLVTDQLSMAIREQLRENNIEFIDTKGNIYLYNSSTYILVENNSSESNKLPSKSSAITIADLKVSYVILRDSRFLKASVQELAIAAGVNVKTVQRSFEKLYKHDYLERQRGGEYKIKDYIKLLERWEMGYLENLRSELLIDTFSLIGNRKFADLCQEIITGANLNKWLIGGELGAAILTNYLEPISAVLYIPETENYRLIMAQLYLKPDPKGNISLLKQFGTQNYWDNSQLKPIADPLLLHTELIQNTDERLQETAKRIFLNYIYIAQNISKSSQLLTSKKNL